MLLSGAPSPPSSEKSSSAKATKAASTKRGKYHAFSIQDRLAHIAAQKKSGLTQKAYCVRNDIPQSTFASWQQSAAKGTLNNDIPAAADRFRVKTSQYEAVEKKMVQYIDLRTKLYQRDGCGLSWLLLHDPCSCATRSSASIGRSSSKRNRG